MPPGLILIDNVFCMARDTFVAELRAALECKGIRVIETSLFMGLHTLLTGNTPADDATRSRMCSFASPDTKLFYGTIGRHAIVDRRSNSVLSLIDGWSMVFDIPNFWALGLQRWMRRQVADAEPDVQTIVLATECGARFFCGPHGGVLEASTLCGKGGPTARIMLNTPYEPTDHEITDGSFYLTQTDEVTQIENDKNSANFGETLFTKVRYDARFDANYTSDSVAQFVDEFLNSFQA